MLEIDKACIVLSEAPYSDAKKKRIRQRVSVQRGAEWPEVEVVERGVKYRKATWKNYKSMADLMAAVLKDDLHDAAAKGAAAFDAITIGGNLNALGKALDGFETLMKGAFTDNTERVVLDTLDRLLDRGALVAGLEQGLRDTVAANDVIEGLMESAKFHTNDFFSQNVLPDIYGKLDDIQALNLSPTDTLKEIRELAMAGVDAGDYRGRITANGAASKAYHYGVVKGAWDAGFRVYEFVAIQDDRTSEVCDEMDGKQFSIASAVTEAERRTQGSEDDVATFAPWFTTDDIEDKTEQELIAMGCLIPPLHANCRSSIELS